jgi:hypothetical protein
MAPCALGLLFQPTMPGLVCCNDFKGRGVKPAAAPPPNATRASSPGRARRHKAAGAMLSGPDGG